MNREIHEIISAFRKAEQQGRQTALATVVHVEGSSYRRPGARMLVEDNGRITGAISGGCLEGDAMRKALLAIQQGQNKLVAYDSLNDDDAKFGVQLGCNGIVYILFEPIHSTTENNPISILEKLELERKNVVIGTLFSLRDFQGMQPGTCIYFSGNHDDAIFGNITINGKINEDLDLALQTKSSSLVEYDETFSALIEFIEPPVHLYIIGAGNDAFPLVEMATVLGWNVTVIDGRSSHANAQRFPGVRKIIVAKPGEIIKQVSIDNRTFIVLMTHNYNYDLEAIESLVHTDSPYVGILGPRKRLQKLLDELHSKGVVMTDQQQGKIYGPIGLDIGAETAEEIALSILAEIKTIISGRSGTSLRMRSHPIHVRLQENNKASN